MLSALVAQKMIKAVLFDFNETLIRSRAWMSLETRTLPQEAFDLLAAQDHILPLDPERQAHAQKIFRQARETANAAGRETRFQLRPA